jgi:hypothetical protein
VQTSSHLLARHLRPILICLSACASDPPHELSAPHDLATERVHRTVDLIDHGHWREYSAAEDPLLDHQPANLDCGAAGWYVEPAPPVLEVDTSYCNYALLEHPSLAQVERGDTIRLELRHYDLRAAELAQAHIAILFRDQLEWETFVPIPSDATVQTFQWSADHPLAIGEPIRVHLHNHGQNTWVLASLQAETAIQ